jgi:hypothetical protein
MRLSKKSQGISSSTRLKFGRSLEENESFIPKMDDTFQYRRAFLEN